MKFAGGDVEEAYEIYYESLELTDDETERNEILVALAYIHYQMYYLDNVKDLLFQR